MELKNLLTCHQCMRYALAALENEHLCLKCLLERIEDSDDPALREKIRPLDRNRGADADPALGEEHALP